MILYRALMLIALPVLSLIAARRGGLRERLALTPATAGPVWVHGASNGEITSARRVIEALALHDRVLITCNNPTAKVMVASWGIPNVLAVLAPFDAMPVVARFLNRWQPKALIVIENELWPERILATAKRAPVLAIGARMSARSAQRWHKIPLMRRVMASLSWVSAQDADSEARLVALGLAQDRIGPRMMLKAGVVLKGQPLPSPHPRDRTLLAASTHEGEDATILDAFTRQTQFQWLILAPRHPVRGPAVAQMAADRGLTVAQRSKGDAPSAQVYVADTMGEMPTWYAMSGATIIGATFVEKGGHTPFEPIANASAVLHGPSVSNFAEVFAMLDAAGGAIPVTAETLATALDLPAARQQQIADAATRALPPAADPTAVIEAMLRLTDSSRSAHTPARPASDG